MASQNGAKTAEIDVVPSYYRLLEDDPDLTMPVAAIEALIIALANTPASTVSETLDLVSNLTAELKRQIPNSISLSAGTDLFQQYLISNLQRPSSSGDFEQIRRHLVQNGKLFVERAKAARKTIANFGRRFIHDGDTILTNGGSRVVGALLNNAAASSNNGERTRFRVVYVLSSTMSHLEDESAANITALRERGIPVASIPSTAVAYCMDQVTQCFVGAEGVVENGGIISRMGTYQIGMLAKATGKHFYVVSESHKFVRLYPLSQQDLGLEQNVVDFKSSEGRSEGETKSTKHGDNANVNGTQATRSIPKLEEAIDYTPPHLISGIITENGILLPSAVSEELIKVWF